MTESLKISTSSSEDGGIHQIRLLFANLDPSKKGNSISVKHLKIILKSLEFERPTEIIRKLDPLNQGFIPIKTVNDVFTMKNKLKCSEEDFREAFHLMDVDGKGFLTLDDLKRMNEENEERMSEEELQEMLDDADFDDMGIVSEENFVKFMLNAQQDAISCNCDDKDNK